MHKTQDQEAALLREELSKLLTTLRHDRENFNKAFGNSPKSLLYFSQDRIKKPSYF